MRIVYETKYEEIQPNRVKELREKAGIEIKDFCRMCDITRTTLWEIETGRKNKMGYKFGKIAEALNISAEDLCNVKE